MLRGLWHLTWLELKIFLREPMGALGTVLMPALAFFGASRFDPRSDKWVRISMFQDMPYPDEMAGRNR